MLREFGAERLVAVDVKYDPITGRQIPVGDD